MLPLRSTRLARRALLTPAHPFSPRHAPHSPANRRFIFQGLSEGFLDLALALPLPPSLPPYSTTIILVTLAARFTLLPIAIWGKKHTQRAGDTVRSELEKAKPIVQKRVVAEMAGARITGEKEYLRTLWMTRASQLLKIRQKEVIKEHKLHPTLAMFLPPLSQLPFFVVFSMTLSRLSVQPTPFDSEAFLTLSTLSHPDPTMVLPIVLGFITMANVESSHWILNATERAELRRAEEAASDQKRLAAKNAPPKLEVGKIIKTSLRGLSVIRIILAAIAPGSVTLFWVTSAAFGLVQTWIMDWMDIRRKRKLRIAIPAEPSIRSRRR